MMSPKDLIQFPYWATEQIIFIDKGEWAYLGDPSLNVGLSRPMPILDITTLDSCSSDEARKTTPKITRHPLVTWWKRARR